MCPSRRSFLARAALGAGGVALAALTGRANPAAKAKRVIWLYMDGGMSHLDTFDPKPRLAAENGKPFPMTIEATQFDSNGPVLASPWKFAPRGKSGLPVSDLFPEIGKRADQLAVIRSMTNQSAVHAAANYWMHTGWGTMGRPSAGAWVGYGLGREADDLPAFVVLNGGLMPTGGVDCFKSGFLPAKHSASVFGKGEKPLPNVSARDSAAQSRQLGLVGALDGDLSATLGRPDALESAIQNYELAAKLQTAVPSLLDLSGETAETKRLYGFDHPYEHTRTYARQCLLARRMAERGVRFVALTMPRVDADNRWDAHGDIQKNHGDHARTVDQPIAALLADLERRGLAETTLVVLTTEFGRTPFSQGGKGRDHNQFGFSVALAGAGVKGGTAFGATDEFGYKAVDGKCQVHDLHATILHLLGLDHTKLTYRFGGRDYRLTDVHGRVVGEVLA